MQKNLSDNLIRARIADVVADRFFGDVARSDLNVGEFEYRFWSICLAFEVSKPGERRGIYVKIPKQRSKNMSVMPFCEQDRKLALNEFDSLVNLQKEWPEDCESVSFVKPLGYLEEYNAIVLERSYGAELSDMLTRSALSKIMFPWLQLRSQQEMLFRIGAALGRFHSRTKTADQIASNRILEKIRGYTRRLSEETSIDAAFSRLILKFADSLADIATPGCASITLNGLRPHSFLIENGGEIKGIDPGKSKAGPPQQDLARMIRSLRSLFWGKPWSRLVSPSSIFEKAFLRGWQSINDLNTPFLSLCIVKQFLRDWVMNLDGLPYKTWPDRKRQAIKRLYIDPSSKSGIRREIVASTPLLGNGKQSP